MDQPANNNSKNSLLLLPQPHSPISPASSTSSSQPFSSNYYDLAAISSSLSNSSANQPRGQMNNPKQSNLPIQLSSLSSSSPHDLYDLLPPDLCSSSPPPEPCLPISPEPYLSSSSSNSNLYHSEGSIQSDSLHSANSLAVHSRNHSAQQSQDTHTISHSSSFKSYEKPYIPPSNSIGTSKLIKSNGRLKVNTLPPWAKSHDDDDMLFEAVPVPSTPAYTFSYSPSASPAHPNYNSQRSRPNSATYTHQQAQQYQHQRSESPHAARNHLSISKLTHPSVSTSTLVPDYPSGDHDWTLNNLRNNAPHTQSTDRVYKRGSSQLSPVMAFDGNDPHPTAGPSSARRSLYRAMTAPSPVFQKLKPLITVNGQRKRGTGDGNQAQEDDDEGDLEHGKRTPTGRHHRTGPHQHPPDDRWWQFTLPTKYRRKVEEYLTRSGGVIGGVEHQDHRGLNVSPKVEVVEIDEDRRKILELLKRHGSPHDTRYSSMDSNDPNYELQRYASIPGVSSLYKLSNEHERLHIDYHHPPTDFPLSAFSRKMSLTPSQQHQMTEVKDGGVITHQHRTLDERSDGSNNNNNNTHFKKPYSTSLHTTRTTQDSRSRLTRIGSYFMNHPTAPLVCRLLNFVLTAISLAICASIRKSENLVDAPGVLGASTVFVLVVAPLALFHNLFAIYCEYFGAPIGIWSVSWKMFHTLSELVFVSLWSAGLALSMNDELRSPLRCQSQPIGSTSISNIPPDLSNRLTPFLKSSTNKNGLSKDVLDRIVLNTLDQLQHFTHRKLNPDSVEHLCRLQASLVSIIFAGLALYTLVLVVSLFRIFIKVSRKY
ncbi:hypothetical protein MJO28_004211 [Puccinia striiformis f. sp. tritici]|uniref:Uncharacterized protein n=2 Tax=Puccinia striiformis TaxID=27350 RepID=A0A2S4VB49_9BASI|nr:hypothetical protein Pst134EB_008322 [Puccinia striiformis f. sp. tritici]KAI7957116.1 hypothetical protein MJO28_004211 [Puccinia striiformis f. sp. tritici]KAI7963658.1 hypothetical protein MJO29_004085 [Puccinia striiformis f. sp. tritici]POW06772.1 hypothetical protein PSTT_08746 [Puccinia striiformis]